MNYKYEYYYLKYLRFQDEVTGVAVSERYIVAQYFMEPTIDVYDRKSLKRLHRLEGEEMAGDRFMTMLNA